jgi:hypothetical protein
MKIKRELKIAIIAYYIINLIFIFHLLTLRNGTSLGYIYIFPAFWIIYLFGITFTSILKRKTWFKNEYKLGTIISIFLCTPILMFVITRLI